MAKHSKRFEAAAEKVEKDRLYTLEEALALETEATLEGFLDPATARRAAEAIE